MTTHCGEAERNILCFASLRPDLACESIIGGAGPCLVRGQPYISRATETKQSTGDHVRSFRLSHHKALAGRPSRPSSALLAADAERRQGVDHAGGDRIALRSASRRLQQGRPEDGGILVTQSERQDSRDHRSQWPWRQTARPVRVRRDPAISCRENRQAPSPRRRAPLANHPVGALPDGRDRADVRTGRLLPQMCRQGDRRQTSARALCRRVKTPARRDGDPP